jgi:hypothetical protein
LISSSITLEILVFEEKLKAQEIKSSEDMAKLKEEMLLNEDYILSLKAESDI